MTPEDEVLFIDFLRSTAPITFIGSFAPTPDELLSKNPKPAGTGNYDYSIWNMDFPWTPQFGQVGPLAHDPTQIGWFYVAPGCLGPHLEWSRSDISRGMTGRLYWGKRTGVEYDISEFEKWVDSIWRWVRKHGRKLEKNAYAPYYLPTAWELTKPNS